MSIKTILPELSAKLKSFTSSNARFAVVRTIAAPNQPQSPTDRDPSTLLILDSSFNPPTKAHLAIATSALNHEALRQHKPPYRLLLLFSTHNADKAPSAASFPQRLALMTLFATDLLKSLSQSAQHAAPIIDIGLTTCPFYTDKSQAITEEGKESYPPHTRHVHLMGYDTITRFLAARYYKDKFDPPLSALEPYFGAGHGLRVSLRPSEDYGSVEEQRAFVDGLGQGRMEEDGGKREWAERISLVEMDQGAGISSTRVRKAAKAKEWNVVEDLCTESVAKAVKDEGIYEGDDRGSKMA